MIFVCSDMAYDHPIYGLMRRLLYSILVKRMENVQRENLIMLHLFAR